MAEAGRGATEGLGQEGEGAPTEGVKVRRAGVAGKARGRAAATRSTERARAGAKSSAAAGVAAKPFRARTTGAGKARSAERQAEAVGAPAGLAVDAKPTVRRAPGRWSDAKKRKFLERLAATANVGKSAEHVKMSDSAAYALRRRDAAFEAQWREALSEGYARLEMLMVQRALAGLDVGEPDAQAAASLSERTILTLLARHGPAVREHRAEAGQVEDRDEVMARVEAKLAEMRERLGAG
jgi:hypothetical protein